MARKVLITRRDRMQLSTVSFSGGSWEANLPLTNLCDYRPQYVAQASSTDSADTTFDVDLGQAYRIGLFHFQNLRITSNSTIRVQAGTDNTFATTLYDSGTVNGWPLDATPMDNNAWGDFTLTGAYASETFAAVGMARYFVPPAVLVVRYIRVTVVDTTAAVPLQIGVFGACEIWEPTAHNFDFGWTLNLVDESDLPKVPFGTTHITRRGKRRQLAIGLSNMPKDEIYSQGLDVIFAKANSEPLVIVPLPDDTASLEKISVYGLLSQSAQITNPYFTYYNMPLTIEQII